ncbi:hypothetical protein IWQ61_004844 [Dispira simplex]|nr:hypothetical protein IWQ61_004844 [Dispira simplex]
MDELNVGHAVPLEALPLVKNIRTSNSNSNGSNNDNGKGIPYGQVVKETDDDTENAAGRNMAVPDQVSPTPEDGLVHHIISQTDLGELGEDDLKLLTEKGILVKEGNDVILNFRQVEKLGILKPGIIKEDGSLPLENWQQISLNGNEHKLDYLVEKSGNDYVYNLNHLAQLIRDIEGANSAESSTTDRASAPMVKSSTMSEMVKQEVHRSKPMLGAQEPNLPDTEASLGHWTEKVSEEHHRYPSTTARSSHSTKKAPLKPLSHDEQVNVLYGIFKKVLAWIKEAKYSGLFSTIS